MAIWKLKACQIRAAHEWTWRLYDQAGELQAEKKVLVDPSETFWQAFLDLGNYLDRAAYRSHEYQAKLIEEIGEALGREVFGELGSILVDQAPLVVRLEADKGTGSREIRRHFLRPLEIARIGGLELALHRVRFVVELGKERTKVQAPPLRVLAIFSLPQSHGATLNLRQERYQLRQQLRDFQSQGFAIELKVLQFGATRGELTKILEDGEGWDVVHFSGHGSSSYLVIEDDYGRPDVVHAAELADILKLNRDRLRLVTLSCCSSSAVALDATRSLLGLTRSARAPEETGASGTQELPLLAEALAEKLNCAVLAMRYSVTDLFAIDLTSEVYQRLLELRQSLPLALSSSLFRLMAPDRRRRYPAFSLAVPLLLGAQAADLKMELVKVSGFSPNEPARGFAFLPPPPDLLVGRVPELTAASRALAVKSGFNGIIFHGMAGGGKSSCALELAWLFEDLPRFSHVVFYRAPDLGESIEDSLIDFAHCWELGVPDSPLVHVAGHPKALRQQLPQLSFYLQRHSVLLVLDNLESLLRRAPSAGGEADWINPLWSELWTALHDHDGPSRAVATSRLVPKSADTKRAPHAIARIPLHALSLDEALLLCHQAKNLGNILATGENEGLAQIRKLLEVVQGHPKLLDLADHQAGDRKRFAEMLRAAESRTGSTTGRLNAFFEQGESSLGEIDFQDKLSQWTESILSNFPDCSKRTFEFLCHLEEADRQSWVVVPCWEAIRLRLINSHEPGDFPDILRHLESAALLSTSSLVGERGKEERFTIHAGVAEAVRANISSELTELFDEEVAGFFRGIFEQNLEKEGDGGTSTLISDAGRRAAHYELRRSQWDRAAILLDAVARRDKSHASLSAVLPPLRRIATATAETPSGARNLAILGRVLANNGQPEEAVQLLQKAAAEAEALGHFLAASSSWGTLAHIQVNAGRFEEALQSLERKQQSSAHAGVGPWSKLSNEVLHLQILLRMGREQEVLELGAHLQKEIDRLELSSEDQVPEASTTWNVVEGLLNTQLGAASELGHWEEALQLNAALIAKKQQRGAAPSEIARMRFNDFAALLSLGRIDQAYEIASHCRSTFEASNDYLGLGRALRGLADIEQKRQNFRRALDYSSAALRYKYAAEDPEDIAIGHSSLAFDLQAAGADLKDCVAHQVACLILLHSVASPRKKNSIANLAHFLANLPFPHPTIEELIETAFALEAVPGTPFRGLQRRQMQRTMGSDAEPQSPRKELSEALELAAEIRRRRAL